MGSSSPGAPRVVITGASSGIGAACARRFAREQARMALVARRTDRLESVADDVRSLGGEAVVVPADLSRDAEARAAMARAEEALGAVDVLVNNAAFGIYAPLESVPRTDLERLFALNTFGALACIQSLVPGMRARNRGHIINISSVVGKRALPMTGAYAASKYALHGISDALRLELRGTNVSVSVVCPGYTDTEFSERVLDYGAGRNRRPRDAMPAEEVADVIWRCFRSPKREIVLTGKGRAIVAIHQFFPALADWILSRRIPVYLPALPEGRDTATKESASS